MGIYKKMVMHFYVNPLLVKLSFLHTFYILCLIKLLLFVRMFIFSNFSTASIPAEEKCIQMIMPPPLSFILCRVFYPFHYCFCTKYTFCNYGQKCCLFRISDPLTVFGHMFYKFYTHMSKCEEYGKFST